MSLQETNHLTCIPNPAISAWVSNVRVWVVGGCSIDSDWRVTDSESQRQRPQATPLIATKDANLVRSIIKTSARGTANPPQKFSGTTVVVPTPGELSGISPDEGEQSALPQTDNQVAADILVLLQQDQTGNRVCKRNGHRPRAAIFRVFNIESIKKANV